MAVSSVVTSVVGLVQKLTTLLAALHLTAPLWPDGTTVKDSSKFDFIVVGAGTAGSALAARLAEVEDVSVLLIEAGGNPPLSSVATGAAPLLAYSEYDWKYKSEPDDNVAQGHMEKALNLTAGKMLGGSSALNHAIYARGFPNDYNRWADAANDSSWNYDNIFKYLLKTEYLKDKEILKSEFAKYHGTNGTTGTTREHHDALERYLDAFNDVGYEVLLDTANGKLAFSEMFFMVTENTRQSTAKTYLINQIKKNNRKNVSLLKNTFVTQVIFDENNVATGVKALDSDGKEVSFYANKEVILSAGTFNSAKILLLSGVGPKEELENLNINVIADLPVGENYQDHPFVFLVEETQNLPLLPVVPNLLQFPAPALTGYVALNKSQSYPDYQHLDLLFQNKLVFSILCSVAFSYSNDICDNILSQTIGKEFLLLITSFLNPVSRGKVSLQSTDPKAAPIIKTGILTEEADVLKMISIIEDALRIENSTYFKSMNSNFIKIDLPECESYTYRSEDYWRCYIKYMSSSTYHYSSTCSMGSVVDSKLNVIGLKNLRVVDASVMPYVASGNTQIPVLVIAEKAADIIKEAYGYVSSEDTSSDDSDDDTNDLDLSDSLINSILTS